MSRHVNVCVPHSHADHISHLLYTFPHAFKIVRFNTFTTVHISFKVQPKHLQEVILRLGAAGCGESYGTIDVFACVLTRPLLEVKVAGSENKRPKYSVSDRLTVDEIEDIVEDGNHLTFDYMAQIAVASVIAAVGLITDSSTVVIAAMLVSPLMGPILSITFGAAVLKKRIVMRGLRNEVIGVVISWVVGYVCGMAMYGISGTEFDPGAAILDRGRVPGLIAGTVVAAASGIGVILALSKGGVNAIVGTSISASLLPPCVNSGLCTAYLLCILYLSNDTSQASRYRQTSVVSLVLYILNFVIIIVVGILTFRYIKKIYPHNDPRNLPHNPDLNIPRSLLSEADTSSVDSSVDALTSASPYRSSYEYMPSEINSPRIISHISSGSNDIECPLLPSDGTIRSGEHFVVENSIDSPEAVLTRKRQQSDVQDV